MIRRRRTLVSAAVLGAHPWLLAQAQAPAATRSYAVMSLVADQMSVVIRQPQVGSAIDQNRRESVPIAAANIDDSALVAAHEVLKRLEPGAAVHLLKVSETSLGFGFLAPYVYAKLSLVDLRQAKVLGDERIEASTTLSAAHATEGVNPWDAVPNAKKIATLRQMVVDALRDTVPVVLASRPAGG